MSFIKAAELGKKVLDDYNAAMDEQDKIKQGSTVIDVVARHEKEIQELKRLVTPTMEFNPEKSKQEPVGWLVTYGGLTHVEYTQPTQAVDTHYQPLYTSPKHTWVGLTDEEVFKCSYDADEREDAMRAVEAKLKEKNGG